MKIFEHVFYSWFLANFFASIFLSLGMYDYVGAQTLMVLLILVIASFPCLLLGTFLLTLLLQRKMSRTESFLAWLIIATAIVVIYGFLTGLAGLMPRVLSEEWRFVLPVLGATILAILIRYSQFFTLADEVTRKNDNNILQ